MQILKRKARTMFEGAPRQRIVSAAARAIRRSDFDGAGAIEITSPR